MKILLAGLIMIFALAGLELPAYAKAPKKKTSLTTRAKSVKSTKKKPLKKKTGNEEVLLVDPKTARNPFIPLVTPEGRFLKLEEASNAKASLEGIIYDPKGLSYALINGQVLKVGDKVESYQVVRIEERKVILACDGNVIPLELTKEDEP